MTYYREEYERNNKRLKENRWHKAKRMSTVEPVFGTLINFLGMRKVNTRGIKKANKCMLMAACAFNLKKLLKYAQKPRKTAVLELGIPEMAQKGIKAPILIFFNQLDRLLATYFLQIQTC